MDQQNNQLETELLELGFQLNQIKQALQLTNDREKAVELILEFQEDTFQNINQTNPNYSVSNQLQNAIQNIMNQNSNLNQENEDSEDFEEIEYKMIMVVRKDLQMGVGKIAAQVGHAGAYQQCIWSNDEKLKDDLTIWESQGARKICLKCNSKEELLQIQEKAIQMKINNYLVADAGKTQIEAGSLTVLSLGPAQDEDLDKITSKLKLL